MVQWTKGHFETIAKILGESLKKDDSIENLISRFSVLFKIVNPNFDKELFIGQIYAVKYKDWEKMK